LSKDSKGKPVPGSKKDQGGKPSDLDDINVQKVWEKMASGNIEGISSREILYVTIEGIRNGADYIATFFEPFIKTVDDINDLEKALVIGKSSAAASIIGFLIMVLAAPTPDNTARLFHLVNVVKNFFDEMNLEQDQSLLSWYNLMTGQDDDALPDRNDPRFNQ